MAGKKTGFIFKVFITAAVYSALLLPSQLHLSVYQGTDIRPSAFIPIVLGIFWGSPAAVGIFLGNLFCDTVSYHSAIAIFGSLLNGLAALVARCLYYLPVHCKMLRGQYIYDLWSLIKFIVTILVVELSLACGIGVVLNLYSGTPFSDGFNIVFLNNISSIYVFGIPVMLFLPYLSKWADEPSVTVEKNPALFGFKSIRSTAFRRVMISAILSAALLMLLFLLRVKFKGSLAADSLKDIFHFFAVVGVIFLVFSAAVIQFLQKKLVDPLQNVASRLSVEGETYSDEFDIISKSLDFIVSGSANLLSGNEFSIIIGLASKDFSKKFSVGEARGIINDICLQHVNGYTSVDGVGGYKGENDAGMEQMLIYTIYGASDQQIREISDDILNRMNQESVLIEKNKSFRFYYYGNIRLGN